MTAPLHRGGRPRPVRWELLWWGFGSKPEDEVLFAPDASPVHRWRVGPLEIRMYRDDARRHGDQKMHGAENDRALVVRNRR
jgi:hypothetical protein